MLKYLSAFLLFTSLGYLGNYFKLPLFFGLDFLFGSIFSFTATYLYGLRMGVAVTAIASTHTFFIWQHPFGVISLILESLWVGIGINRQRKQQKSVSMIWLVLSYWLIPGALLNFLIYTFILKFGASSALLVLLKQTINGAFNALIAHLLVDYLPLQQWLSKISEPRTVRSNRPKIQQALFDLLLAFVLLPILSIASLTGYQSQQYIQNEISNQLRNDSKEISASVKEWHYQKLLVLQKLSEIATESNFPEDLTRLRFATEALGKVSPAFLRLYIADAQANLVTTVPLTIDADGILNNDVEQKIFEQAKVTLSPVFSDVYTGKTDIPHIDVIVPIFKNNQFNGVIGGSLDITQFKNLLTKVTDIRSVEALILGRSQQVVASTVQRFKAGDTWDFRKEGETKMFRENQFHWLPFMKGSSIMTRWRESFYIQKTVIGDDIPWTVVTNLSPASFINTLESLHIYILLIVLVIIFVATWVANLLSRRFVKPLSKLVRLTTELQANISQSTDFAWRYTELEEIDTLGNNFQVMAIALREKFQEIQQANLNLEKRIEERSTELLKSELKLEKITNAVLGVVYQFRRDPEGNYSIPFISQGAYDIYEITREEICRDVYQAINLNLPEGQERFINSIEESAQSLTPWILEYRIKTPSGKIKWLSGKAQPLPQEDGSIIWNGIITDITKFKLTKEALQKSEERWHLAVQASESGIWDWNIETDAIFRSDRWWTMLGFEAGGNHEQEFKWHYLLHPDDRDDHLQQQDDYLKQKIPRYYVESRMRAKDGNYRWILTRGVAVWNQQNEAIRLVGTTSDVTDLKIARAEITQAMEEAQAANRAKSDFLATMSHEIRTPMNAVIGMAQLLLDTRLDEEQQEFAEIIRSSGDNLLTIINSILDFSKIESGRFNLDLHTFNLRFCVEECLDVIAAALPKDIELACCIDPDIPEWIVGDSSRLRQVLINLLSNAVKFTHQGAVTLQISALDTFISEDAEDSLAKSYQYKLQFKIKDTGIGIPRDRYDRLFKPFSQVDSSTTRQYGGTGLGLAITKRLTELMGGDICVESELGVGSCFTFSIGVFIATQNSAYEYFNESSESSDIQIRSQLSGCKLLILEDNQVSREDLINLAKSLNMQVFDTSSVTEAIAWIQEGEKFDLAIIDACISLTDDRKVSNHINQINWIRQQFPLLPILFLTCCYRSDINLRNDSLTSYINRPAKRSQVYGKLFKLFNSTEDNNRLNSKSIPKFDDNFANKFPLSIMLAEDNVVNQKVAIRFLSRLGYYVDIAQNGCEVFDLMNQKEYDVILMDIHMPVMDGVTATRKILNDFKPHPWVVALTANASTGDREFYLSVGMHEYISKPIQIKELTRVLEKAHHALKLSTK